MTELVVKAINKMGAAQKSKNNKVSGKANQIKLRPADWRTGVDSLDELTNAHDNIELGDDDDESSVGSDGSDGGGDNDSDDDMTAAPPLEYATDDSDDEESDDEGDSDDEEDESDDEEDDQNLLDQEEVIELLAEERMYTPIDMNENHDDSDDDSDDDSEDEVEMNPDEDDPDDDHGDMGTPATVPETPFTPAPRRSERQRNQPQRLNYTQAEQSKQEWADLEAKHNVELKPGGRQKEYTPEGARLMAQYIVGMRYTAATKGADILNLGQQHQLGKGLKLFGEDGTKATKAELGQIVNRQCYEPVDISTLTESEKEKAQGSMMLLNQKQNGEVKARQVFNGKGTRGFYTREESASPTASGDSVMLTSVVDANERRDTMTNDAPNAFIQAHVPEGKERIIMKTTGVLVDMFVAFS